jgi:hypothetical protein
LSGNFSVEEAVKLLKESEFRCISTPKWVLIENDFYELKSNRVDADYPVDHDYAAFSHKWIYDEKLVESVLRDPRHEGTPSLKKLKFNSQRN